MEKLNKDEKIIMKKLLRNEKARIKYNESSIAGCNKKLLNKQSPTKRGRKGKIIDISVDEPKEPTEVEKLFDMVIKQNRKQKYNKITKKE